MKKTKWQKIASLLVVVLLLGSAVWLPSSAESSLNNIYSTVSEATAGTVVEIPIFISNNSGIAGFGIYISYDSDVLTPISVFDFGGVISGKTQNTIGGTLANLPPDTVKVMFSNSSNFTDNGLLFTAKFYVDSNASGNTLLTVTYDKGDTIDDEINEVSLNCNNISLSISDEQTDDFSKINLTVTETANTKNVSLSGILEKSNGLQSAEIKIQYDPSVFQYNAVNSNASVSGVTNSENMLQFTLTDISKIIEGNPLFEIGFTYLDDIPAGDYQFIGYAESVTGANGMYFTDCMLNVPEKPIATAKIETIKGLSGNKGQTVKVPIVINDNPGLMGYKLSFAFDGNDIVPLNAINLGLFPGNGFYDNIGLYQQSFDVLWNGISVGSKNGQLFYIEFEILNDAQKITEITVSYSPPDTYDENYNDVKFQCENIQIPLNFSSNPIQLTDIEYDITNDGWVIKKYIGTNTTVNIPDEFTVSDKTYPVIGIEESAFEANRNIVSVSIPESVLSIGDYAFYDCTALKSITVYGENTVIGEKAIGYYYIDRKTEGIVDGLTLYGKCQSTLKQYAAENGIPFQIIQKGTVVGDANGDGEINANDLITIRQYLLGIETETDWRCIDVNQDGVPDIRDLVREKKLLVTAYNGIL